jgi:hypothetical protein
MAAFVEKIEVVLCEQGTVIEDRLLPPATVLCSGFIHEETPFSLSSSLTEKQEGQTELGLTRAP